MKSVAIIGASENPERYACMAQQLLRENGYDVVPISLRAEEILGIRAYRSLGDYDGRVDTVTLYVGAKRVESLVDDILAKEPRRVIFNPGTEAPDAMRRLSDEGVEVIQACTLVMLRTGQF